MWGFLHGPQRAESRFRLRFDLPARCADALATGEARIGLVPCAEIERLGLDFLPDTGIACDGAVRSILLFSKVPFREVRTLAVDAGSRTSVALCRILLRERYGVSPILTAQEPELERMLEANDAALVIGDPALRLDPGSLPWHWMDLGAEWRAWTGLPMVFAAWAGRGAALSEPGVREAFVESWRWGSAHLEEIVARAGAERGFGADVTRRYLTEAIRFELDAACLEGLSEFRKMVRKLDADGL